MTTLNLLGMTGAFVSFVLFVPQVKTVWINRTNPTALNGVSEGTQWLALAGAVNWGLYAHVAHSFWIGASGILNAPMAVWVIWTLHRCSTRPAVESALESDDYAQSGWAAADA